MNHEDNGCYPPKFEDGLTHEIRTHWVRCSAESELVIRGQTEDGYITLAQVYQRQDGKWRWIANNTAGITMQRADAERLCQLRLKYDDHDAWMQQAKDLEWASPATMIRTGIREEKNLLFIVVDIDPGDYTTEELTEEICIALEVTGVTVYETLSELNKAAEDQRDQFAKDV